MQTIKNKLFHINTKHNKLAYAASKLDDWEIPYKVSDQGIFVRIENYLKANRIVNNEDEMIKIYRVSTNNNEPEYLLKNELDKYEIEDIENGEYKLKGYVGPEYKETISGIDIYEYVKQED